MRYILALLLTALPALADTNFKEGIPESLKRTAPLIYTYFDGTFASRHAPPEIRGTLTYVAHKPVTSLPHVIGFDFDYEWTGTYSTMYSNAFAFDAHTHRPITLRQLLSRKGQKAFIAALNKKERAATFNAIKHSSFEGEEFEEQKSTYLSCLEFPTTELPDDLLLQAKGLSTRLGRCMPNASKYMDERVGADLLFTYDELTPWLSRYGRCRLLKRRAQCNQPADLVQGVYQGTLGRQRITLVLSHNDNAHYFYHRHGKYIDLFAHIERPFIALHEGEHRIYLKHTQSGKLVGHWQDQEKSPSKRHPVRLQLQSKSVNQ